MTSSDKKERIALLLMIVRMIQEDPNKAIEFILFYVIALEH